jgi:hypothetical protein
LPYNIFISSITILETFCHHLFLTHDVETTIKVHTEHYAYASNLNNPTVTKP